MHETPEFVTITYMRHRESFTLLEAVIVMALVMALAVALLAALDPLEQVRKTNDLSVLVASKDVYGAIMGSLIRKDIPWQEDIEGIALSSPAGKEILKKLIEDGELKTDAKWSDSMQLDGIFLTAPWNGTNFHLCFQPVSKSYRLSDKNRYDRYGALLRDCPASSCYTCIAGTINAGVSVDGVPETVPLTSPTPTSGLILTPSPTSVLSGTPIPENPKCDNFDPERPVFAHTCNYSDKWIMFGCTNYCVADLGCGVGDCGPDERRLRKHYYNPAHADADFSLCWMYEFFTTEEYCISGKEANCGYKNYPSSELDYHWGCVNPVRPYEWITYQ